ncbi:MAG: hypothetical protein KDA21_12445, partial [Phycisphaerales bacterium]|nr:hypothetical protein [Phycisphaerales bacterium]
SWMTRRFEAHERREAERFLEEILERRAALVQRCMPGFEAPGERSLVWIDGAWTHAILKRPRFAGEDEQVHAHGAPTARERAVASSALAGLEPHITYARVDLVPDDTGADEVVISEVELIEPSLFFDHCPTALERYVDALERVAGAGL